MTDDDEITRLGQAVVALEAQRAALGDAVVEAGLAPMREKLAALRSLNTPAEQQRKLATVLFMDIAEHTHLVRDLDPEEIMAIIDSTVARMAEFVCHFGGRIARYQGDGFKAVFGLPTAREDDPENAVRAALAIQEAAGRVAGELGYSSPDGFRVRIGINTGLVFAGGRTEGEDTISGMTVNLAARLEAKARPGTILISHNTYRHIRGVFDLQPLGPVAVKGVAEPLPAYVVLRAKPRAFRMASRGVEGVATNMIGREAEHITLQMAYTTAMGAAQTRAVTIVGEAGVGKSRLLDEFVNWLDLRPEGIFLLKGRAGPNTRHVPYSLFHDLFAFRFQILDSDPTAVALEKFRNGMAGALEPDRADVAGHWLGFDFSSSDAVRTLLGSPGFATSARAHLARYFRAVASAAPVVVMLEDIHWADDQSLDLVKDLATAIPDARLLLLATARPEFFERQPDWSWEERFERIELAPLSRPTTLALVDEVLQRVESLPPALRELIANSAEGNPFYVEELARVLIDQGVIEREAPDGGEERWSVRLEKLQEVKVPTTLAALLQARLDSLPRPERRALQRASVVGRVFWDDAVAELLSVRRETLRPILEAASKRGIIYREKPSSFDGVAEYHFKHGFLRDVAYESVLLKERAAFHGQVAHWLENRVGERLGEYSGLIAEHYVQAGERLKAAALLEQAGEDALKVGAHAPARRALERALALRQTAGETSGRAVMRANIGLSNAYRALGDLPAAEAALARGLASAREAGDIQAEAEALIGLAMIANAQGAYDRARTLTEAARPLARAADGRTLALARWASAYALWSAGDLTSAEKCGVEALHAAREIGAVALEIEALNVLGNITTTQRDLGRALAYAEAALELARQAHHLTFETRALLNLGHIAYVMGDFAAARSYGQEALERARELGLQLQMVNVLGNLAQADLKLGDTAAARRGARELLVLSRELGYVPAVVVAVFLFGQILDGEGEETRALALYGLARTHPALEHQLRLEIDEEMARLALPQEAIEAGLAAGEKLDFETVIDEILAGKW
jgi:class 3 adenylate cyclase/tetratricopeptide (TPR) repeat protein